MKDQRAIFLALIALLPVRFAFFRLRSPINILIFVAKNVYFFVYEPDPQNDNKYHTCEFMKISNILANLHYKCNLRDACSLFFLLWCILFSYFCKNVLPAAARSTFLKTNSEQSAFNNPLFWALNALNGRSVGHLFGIYCSFARSVRHFSASIAHQNFDFR